MLTSSLKPIRLLLQLLTADAFIGERDKVTTGQVIDLKRQGSCGRLQIITATGSCVWRLSSSVVDAILALWSKTSWIGLSSHSDATLDYIAEQFRRCPRTGNLIVLELSTDASIAIGWDSQGEF